MKALASCESPMECVKRGPAGLLALHEAGASSDDVIEAASDEKPESHIRVNDSWSGWCEGRIGDDDADGSVLR